MKKKHQKNPSDIPCHDFIFRLKALFIALEYSKTLQVFVIFLFSTTSLVAFCSIFIFFHSFFPSCFFSSCIMAVIFVTTYTNTLDVLRCHRFSPCNASVDM